MAAGSLAVLHSLTGNTLVATEYRSAFEALQTACANKFDYHPLPTRDMLPVEK